MDRRHFINRCLATAATGAAAAALAACGDGGDDAPPRRTYLLVHGAWHNAQHWNLVANALSARGHRVVAIDLPGNGLLAALPQSYLRQDLAALATEVSPVKDVTLQQQSDAIVAELRRLASQGPVVLVAHSAGGLPMTMAVEAAPELVTRMVYLSAHCPVALPNMVGYLGLPENASARLNPTFIGDFGVLGAVRINPRAADAAYQEALRIGFYNDLTPLQARPWINLLTPDLPLHVAIDEVHPTAARWGRVPRSYIRTLQDNAFPLPLQDRQIAEADAFTPGNRFQVQALDSSHSSFASRPDELAALLDALA